VILIEVKLPEPVTCRNGDTINGKYPASAPIVNAN
jgi:hypothetical protein